MDDHIFLEKEVDEKYRIYSELNIDMSLFSKNLDGFAEELPDLLDNEECKDKFKVIYELLKQKFAN